MISTHGKSKHLEWGLGSPFNEIQVFFPCNGRASHPKLQAPGRFVCCLGFPHRTMSFSDGQLPFVTVVLLMFYRPAQNGEDGAAVNPAGFTVQSRWVR